MANYPYELAQNAVYQSHTGRRTGLWFLPNWPKGLNTTTTTNNKYSSVNTLPRYLKTQVHLRSVFFQLFCRVLGNRCIVAFSLTITVIRTGHIVKSYLNCPTVRLANSAYLEYHECHPLRLRNKMKQESLVWQI
jgi:hypothetical protein